MMAVGKIVPDIIPPEHCASAWFSIVKTPAKTSVQTLSKNFFIVKWIERFFCRLKLSEIDDKITIPRWIY